MRRVFAVFALAAILLPAAASGQSKTGTAIGDFLLIEPSARITAMGNAGVSLGDGIQAVYYNPATLGRLDRPSLQFTHSAWLADIKYDYAAAVLPLSGWGRVMASLTALSSGDIAVRTVEHPLGTGENYSVSDLAVGLGYGRAITERFTAGIQVNYVEETIWHTSMKTLSLNLGTVYRVASSGLQIGSSISNYGSTARFGGRDLEITYDNDPTRYGDNGALPADRYTDRFSLPTLFRVGLSLPRRLSTNQDLLLAVDAFHASDNNESMSLGAEWRLKDAFSLRMGYQNLFLPDTEVGLTLGAGLKGKMGETGYALDYAWADHGRLEGTHRLSFVLTL